MVDNLKLSFDRAYLSNTLDDPLIDLGPQTYDLILGHNYYNITNQSIFLNSDGAEFNRLNGYIPAFGLRDASTDDKIYFLTKSYSLTDDVHIKGQSDIKDFANLQIKYRDATEPNHFIALLSGEISGVSNYSQDIIGADLIVFAEERNASNSGKLNLFQMGDTAWSEQSLVSSPYTTSSPEQSVDNEGRATFIKDFDFSSVEHNFGDLTQDISFYRFDLGDSVRTDERLSFALLPEVDNSEKFFLHSSEETEDRADLAPKVLVTIATSTPVMAVADQLSVLEAKSSILTPVNIFMNDQGLGQNFDYEISTINGIAWEDLPVSDHQTFKAHGNFKQVDGDYGSIYLQQNGRIFYESNNDDLTSNVSDIFTYTFFDGGIESTVGQISVNIEPANQAPEIVVSPKNLFGDVEENDVAANFQVFDADSDALYVGWNNEGVPTDASGSAIYAIDAINNQIILTQAGAQFANFNGYLPEISLVLVDDAEFDQGSTVGSATPHIVVGTAYFVDQTNGVDTNSGVAVENAFASINAANSVVQPGDTVFIVGDYARDDYDPAFQLSSNIDLMDPYVWNSQSTVLIKGVHGTEDTPITYRGWDNTSKIIAQGTAGIQVRDSSYVNVEQLEVVGLVEQMGDSAKKLQFAYRMDVNENNGYNRDDYRYLSDSEGNVFDLYIGSTFDEYDDVAYDYFYRVPPDSSAEFVKLNFSDPDADPLIQNLDDERPALTSTRGILIKNSQYINVDENHVHHIPGTGIRVAGSEYVSVVGNEVNDTTRASSQGTQALVVSDATHLIDVADDLSNIYKIIIARNEVHHNFNEVYSWVGNKTFITPHLDEGNGVSPQWLTDDTWIADDATGLVLLAENVTYLNGLSGVNNHAGDRVVIANNTGWLNSYYGVILGTSESGTAGGIQTEADQKNGVEYGDDIWFFNNLAVANSDHNGGNHYAIRINAESPRVVTDAATGRIGEAINYIGGTNVGLDYQDREIKLDASALDVLLSADVEFSVDQLFVDPANFDFRLTSDSPLLNLGTDLSQVLPGNLSSIDGGTLWYSNEYQIGATSVEVIPDQLRAVQTDDIPLNYIYQTNLSDNLLGTINPDSIVAGEGADLVQAEAGNDTITLQSSDTWSSFYRAWNVETNDRQALDGKTKYSTVIDAGDDADTLILSDSSAGDAFFLHDSYSGLHNSLTAIDDGFGRTTVARALNLETIKAGDGNDIIDLTSPTFDMGGIALTLEGEAGDDILWAAEGDDTLNGGAGNDVLFGGEGNDTLIGGTDADVFEFVSSTNAQTDTISDYSSDDKLKFYLASGQSELDQSNISNGNLVWNNLTIDLAGMDVTSLDQLSIVYEYI